MKFVALFFIIVSVLFSWDRASSASSFAVARYRIDASKSKFIVHANRSRVFFWLLLVLQRPRRKRDLSVPATNAPNPLKTAGNPGGFCFSGPDRMEPHR